MKKIFVFLFAVALVVFSTNIYAQGCQTPTGLQVIKTTSTTAEIAWDEVGAPNGWSVIYAKAGTTDYNQATIKGSLVNHYTIQGLESEVEYEVVVAGICGLESSIPTAALKFATLPANCQAPKNVKVVAVDANTALITWDEVFNAKGYGILYGENSVLESVVAKGTAVNYYEIKNLKPETEYTFVVNTGCNKDEISNPTAPATFVTLAGDQPAPVAPASAPTNFNVDKVTATGVEFSWNQAGNPKGWVLMYGEAPVDLNSVITIKGTYDPNYKIENLKENTEYEVYIAASFDKEDVSPALYGKFTTLKGCPMPSDAQVVNTTVNSATFSWDPNGTVKGFGVIFGEAPVDLMTSKAYGTYTPEYTFENLEHGKEYELYIVAGCSKDLASKIYGPFKYKHEVFWVTGNTGTSAILNWQAFDGANSYYVQFIESGTTGKWRNGASDGTSRQVYSLVPGQEYDVRILKYANADNTGYLGWEGIYQFTAAITENIITASQDIGTSFLLSWEPIEGADAYVPQIRKAAGVNWDGSKDAVTMVNKTNRRFWEREPGEEYAVRIIAYKAGQFIGVTGEKNITTKPSMSFKVTQNTGESAVITWDNVGASKHIIHYRAVGEAWLHTNAFVNSKKLVELVPGTTYEYRLLSYFMVDGVEQYGGATKIHTFVAGGGKSAVAENTTSVNVYPNPFVDALNIEVEAEANSTMTYTIVDVVGKVVKTGTHNLVMGYNNINIDVTELPTGVYVINADNQSFTIVK